VAYSGGVDSAYLAWAARKVLGTGMLAVTADSPSMARAQLHEAVAFAEEHAIPHRVIATSEFERPEYVRNDLNRCFYCKDTLFTEMERVREETGFAAIAYGMNLDDRRDFRPGQKAAEQRAVAAPLAEVGMGKDDIRTLARRAGLRVWDKPASPCLSSRIEYGRPVTIEALGAIESGEEALHALGFHQVRVRHHGDIVRIEIASEELQRALSAEMTSKMLDVFKKLGFKYVTLDLEGFRSGSLNPR
jgi:uncharacterized protein